MQEAKKKTTQPKVSRLSLQRQATIKPTVPKGKAAPIQETLAQDAAQDTLQRAFNNHLRPVEMQRQVASPALQAAHLYSTEYQGAAQQTASLQRQVMELQASLPANALQSALQRQAQTSATPQRPVTVGDWAFAMQREAQRIEGQRLNTQQHQQFMALQRHVTNTLVQGFRQDRQPAAERYAQYGEHLATLQRHPLSGLVAQSAMRHMPASERPALQRAVDEALQRQQQQDAQDAAALNLQALQRQLAEQEGKAQDSVMQRIQAKRGAGNPLPAAVQRHLEHGLNHDLSGVRIHDDAEADFLAKKVNAVAFTTGSDIFFQSGKYNPSSATGYELLAHEATHTVQQSQGKVGKGIDPDAGLESEAREMGRKLASMQASGAKIGVKKSVQRAPLTAGHAVQRQATGGDSRIIQELVKAINGGDVQKALELLKGMPRDKQTRALQEIMRRFRGKMASGVAEGLQAMIDGLSNRIPEAIKKTVKKGTTINPGPWNPPGNQPAPYYIGTSAHNAIAQFYVTAHAGEQVFTNTRTMSAILGRAGGLLSAAEKLLKPDIVNWDRRHLYEIKSRSQAGLAVSEAAMYLALFKKANVKMELGPIVDPGVIGIIPAPGGHYAFQAIAPGAIVYDYRRGKYDPKAAPAPAPAPNPVATPTPSKQQPVTSPQPIRAPTADPDFMKKMSEITGLTGAALIIYIIISEGSRLFPPRNLVPIP